MPNDRKRSEDGESVSPSDNIERFGMAEVESFQFEKSKLQNALKPIFCLYVIVIIRQMLIEAVEILQLGVTGA